VDWKESQSNKMPEGFTPGTFSRRLFNLLEIKLQAKLNDTHSAIGGDFPKGGAAAEIIGIQELRVIESVEEFCAELEHFAFGDLGFLGQRKIKIVYAWSAKCVARSGAESKERHAGGIDTAVVVVGRSAIERIGIEPEVSLRRSTETAGSARIECGGGGPRIQIFNGSD
jgi:hypothetical protein